MYNKRGRDGRDARRPATRRPARSDSRYPGRRLSMDGVRGSRVNLFCRCPVHHRGYGTQNLVASPYRPLMADPAVLRIRRWRGTRSCRGQLVPVRPGLREARVLYPLSQTVPRLHRLSTMPASMAGEWRAAVRESAPGPGPPRRLKPTSDPLKGLAAGMSGPRQGNVRVNPGQSKSALHTPCDVSPVGRHRAEDRVRSGLPAAGHLALAALLNAYRS